MTEHRSSKIWVLARGVEGLSFQGINLWARVQSVSFPDY